MKHSEALPGYLGNMNKGKKIAMIVIFPTFSKIPKDSPKILFTISNNFHTFSILVLSHETDSNKKTHHLIKI